MSVYRLPLRTRFRNITHREGVLLRGPAGWGEFCPFPEYSTQDSIPWLASAVEACCHGWPKPVRDRVPINSTIPPVSAQDAHQMVVRARCRTAKVKVADRSQTLADDVARLEAVRDAIGRNGKIRVDANGAWDVDQAVHAIKQLDQAAGGLEYVEQPCATIAELAAVRLAVNVPIAADESIRRADDPLRVALGNAADVAVIKCSPLGGVRRALEVAEQCSLPCVISSALETSIGLAAELALAGALPELEFACGIGTASLFAEDVVADPLLPVDGYMPIPTSPPTPDPDLLERTQIDDSHRVDWWHKRLAQVFAAG